MIKQKKVLRHRVKPYDQLISGTVLKNIEKMLSPYGYNVEFEYSEDTQSLQAYKRGFDYAVMRSSEVNQLARDNIFKDVLEKLKEFQERTVVVVYNIDGMQISETPLDLTNRSRIQAVKKDCNKESLIGYTFAKVKNHNKEIEDWESGKIKPLEEVLPPAVEILEIDPIATYTIKNNNYVDIGEAPSKDAIPVKVYKDYTVVDFNLEAYIITPSEKIAKEVNFILLNSMCHIPNDHLDFVEYEFVKGQKFYLPYNYDRGNSVGIVTGGTKSKRVYMLPLNYSVKGAKLFSEYSKYSPTTVLEDTKVDVILKLGVYQR